MDDGSTRGRYADMVDYRSVLAENLKAARKALALSQEELALEADIDRTYVSGIECPPLPHPPPIDPVPIGSVFAAP